MAADCDLRWRTKVKTRQRSKCWKLVVVFASFSNCLLIVGVNHCTGILFASFQNEFRSTTAETAAISSIITSTSFLGASIGGALGNALGCRITAVMGGLCALIGMIGGALTRNIYSFYVMSAVIGTGTGILYTPSLVILAQYFNKGYPLANGFSSCGVGLGMLVYGPLVQTLLDVYGWRGTILIMGAIMANVIAAGAVFRPLELHHKVQEQQERTELNNRTVKTSPSSKTSCLATSIKLFRLNLLRSSYRFAALCFAHCTYVTAYYCFSIYLVPFATSLGISNKDAAFLFSIAGITSIVGRLLCGLMNRKLSAHVIYQLAMFLCGSSILITLLGTYTYFVFSASILGFALGFYQTIVSVLVRDLVGVDNVGSAIGMYSLLSGVANMIGPILAGALYDINGSYHLLFSTFAGLFFLGFVPTLLFPYLKRIEPGITNVTMDNPKHTPHASAL